MKVKISAVIITFNEEKNIERCINSVMDVADEVLVVDSFSTDKTEDICLSKNVSFIKNAFGGHVEQKNFAMEKAQFDCILSLDADEALSPELQNSISKIKDNWEADAYTMNRLTNYCGTWIKHSGWYPDKKIRLWNRQKGRWGGTNPHDKVLMHKSSTIYHLKGDLLHYSFYSIEEHKKQIAYFTDVSAKALYKKGRKVSWLKIIFSPAAQFIKGYVLNRGFLDGKYGWIICTLSAKAKYMRYKKLLNLYRTQPKKSTR